MKLTQKLLEIQKEIGAVSKSETNPFFKSKYFDINKLLEVTKPVLNKHGVVLIQGLSNIDGHLALETMILDSDSDDAIKSICPLPEIEVTSTDKNGNVTKGLDPQKMGGVVTYYRRYALQSLLALEAEDDDGNIASGKITKNDYEI